MKLKCVKGWNLHGSFIRLFLETGSWKSGFNDHCFSDPVCDLRKWVDGCPQCHCDLCFYTAQTTTDELVDIREVAVDKDLPKEERIAAFLRQIKNPYRFRCGDFVVNAAFASNGVTLEECLQGILR